MTERYQKLLQMQSLPLDAKIEASKRRIREWLDVYPDATVSFSGGKDSTVLLHLCRQVKADIVGVFSNTGLEYPEIVEFVNQTPNVITVRPKLDFLSVVQKYGYPVVSKRIAQACHQLRTTRSETLRAKRLSGKYGLTRDWKHLEQASFKISHKCCDALKKAPMKNVPHPFVGVLVTDSDQRGQSYYREGCNSVSADRSWPLSFWIEPDIWNYLRGFNVPYSKIYDFGYDRTGCMFCCFGLHRQGHPNKFELMSATHPGLFRYCMDGPLNLREVIREVYKMEMPAASGKEVL